MSPSVGNSAPRPRALLSLAAGPAHAEGVPVAGGEGPGGVQPGEHAGRHAGELPQLRPAAAARAAQLLQVGPHSDPLTERSAPDSSVTAPQLQTSALPLLHFFPVDAWLG